MSLDARSACQGADVGETTWTSDELETLYVGFVREYHHVITSYLHGMVHSQAQAEDLAQDTFLKAYLALPRVGPPDNPRAWLYRIATNVAIDHIRRRKRLSWVAIDKLAHVLRGADSSAAVEVADPVRRAMAALSADEQSILLLFSHVGLNAPEVAEVLGISAAAARKRRQRAREAFTAAYHEETQE